MLYTVLPADLVWQGFDEAPAFHVVYQAGRILLVRQEAPGRGRVEALWSTDPMDFLNPAWQPGRLLRW